MSKELPGNSSKEKHDHHELFEDLERCLNPTINTLIYLHEKDYIKPFEHFAEKMIGQPVTFMVVHDYGKRDYQFELTFNNQFARINTSNRNSPDISQQMTRLQLNGKKEVDLEDIPLDPPVQHSQLGHIYYFESIDSDYWLREIAGIRIFKIDGPYNLAIPRDHIDRQKVLKQAGLLPVPKTDDHILKERCMDIRVQIDILHQLFNILHDT